MTTADVTFGGTATCLLRLGPFTLLTDPNFLAEGQRAYLGSRAWTKPRTQPALLPGDVASATPFCSRTSTATTSTASPSASSTRTVRC